MAVDTQSNLYFYAASEQQLTQVNPDGEIMWRLTAEDFDVDAFLLLDVTSDGTLLVQTRQSPDQLFSTVQECRVSE